MPLLDASADRRNRPLAPVGRNRSIAAHAIVSPSIAETRSIAASNVITWRSWTTCITGRLRACTIP